MICLMYHRISSPAEYQRARGTERIFSLPADAFEQQIAYLKENGYQFVTPDEVIKYIAGELVFPKNTVLLTFDDGCLSVKNIALPILEKHKACATLFVTTDPESYVFKEGAGADRRLTDEELRTIDGDIINVESHGVTHRPLSYLSLDEIEFELLESKRELERILSREVSYLAIPGNWFNRQVIQVAQEVGYQAVWCSNPGQIKTGSHPFGLPRLNVEGQFTRPQFAASISPQGIVQRRIVSAIKRIPGRILGPRYWLPIRKVIMRCIPGQHVSFNRMLGILTAFAIIIVLLLVGLLIF
ncbi:MAG: polysaccharide deacetylase family protein [Planctomycetota bacterium]